MSCQPGALYVQDTPLPLARHDRHQGMATSATRTGIGVSSGIITGARRSRRLQGLPPQWQGEFATRIQCLRTQMRLPPQRHASYVAWLMPRIRLYVYPQRPRMTMVFRLTVASDC